VGQGQSSGGDGGVYHSRGVQGVEIREIKSMESASEGRKNGGLIVHHVQEVLDTIVSSRLHWLGRREKGVEVAKVERPNVRVGLSGTRPNGEMHGKLFDGRGGREKVCRKHRPDSRDGQTSKLEFGCRCRIRYPSVRSVF